MHLWKCHRFLICLLELADLIHPEEVKVLSSSEILTVFKAAVLRVQTLLILLKFALIE